MPAAWTKAGDSPIARAQEPWRFYADCDSRVEFIDVAIAGLGKVRAGDDRRVADPPALRPGKDEPGPSSLCVAVTLLAARWGALIRPTGRPIDVDRSSVSHVRRRRHVII
jgi:hypothetical protein